MQPSSHKAQVVIDITDSHGGYVFRPACECGWKSPVRYAARHAAKMIAQDHVESSTSPLV